MADITVYAGTNYVRQSIGLPGHCDRCAEISHERAHPTLGCSDVGCDRAHPAEDEFDSPTPSRASRLDDLCRRARDAQDRLGWAEPGSPEVSDGATDLARVVVALASELRTLAREIDRKG